MLFKRISAKSFLYVQLITTFVLVGLCACAQERKGTSHGGGGDDFIADFKAKAGFVVENYFNFSTTERKLLKKSLEECEVVTTLVLKNPVSGEPIADKSKIAWGSRGLIQLKIETASRPNEQSWEKLVKEKMPMAHHIVHELYRCSDEQEYRLIHESYHRAGKTGAYDSKKPPDDGYALSVGIHRLQNNAVLTFKDVSHFECEVTAHGTDRHSSNWIWKVPNTKQIIPFDKENFAKYHFITAEIPLIFWFSARKTSQGIIVTAAGLNYELAGIDNSNVINDIVIPDYKTNYSMNLHVRDRDLEMTRAKEFGITNFGEDSIKTFRLDCTPKYTAPREG